MTSVLCVRADGGDGSRRAGRSAWSVAAVGLMAVALVAVFAGRAAAQQVHWEAPGRIGAGQRAALDLVFEETEPAGRVALPEVDGLDVLGAPTEQSSVSIINGARTSSVTLRFLVRAEKEGQLAIPAFAVATTAGRAAVPALALEVGQAAMPGSAGKAGDIVAARLEPSNMTPYAGEVFDVDATVSLTGGRSAQVTGSPSWDRSGLVAEPWGEGSQVRTQTGSGVRFRTRAIAPQAGRVAAAPFLQEVQVDTGRGTGDPFADFDDPFGALRKFGGGGLLGSMFGTRTAGVTVKSNAVQLDVRPLPGPAPAGFSGAVGRFNLTSRMVPEQPKAGDPVTWTLTLEGTGNWPGGVSLPARAVPSDLRTLQPKQQKDFAQNELFSGSLSEDLVLIPEQPGDYQLDPVHFVYFDPAAGEYRTLAARPPLLHVTGAAIARPRQPAPQAAVAAAAAPAAVPRAEVAAPSAPLPRDPITGSATGWTPIDPSLLPWLGAIPFAGLLGYWLALAVAQARRTDPRRPRREAFARLAPAIEHIRGAATAEARIDALLDWQRTTAIALGLDAAAPTALQLTDPRWSELWAGSELALYGAEHVLPEGWCERALAVTARTARPRFNPLRALELGNLLPKAAVTALLLVLVAAPARAEDAVDAYRQGDCAGAREQLIARVQAEPSDWIARYDLGVAEAQVGDPVRALAETAAAFVHRPRHDDVRWNARAFAARVSGLDSGTAEFFTAPGCAAWASPAEWQFVLLAAAFLTAAGGALLMRERYAQPPRRRLWSLAAVAWLCAGLGLGSGAALALRAYGPLADPRVALIAGEPSLRSVPTDAQPPPRQKPLATGTMVLVERDFLGWIKVGLSGGETGWVRAGDVVPLYGPPRA